MGLKSYSLRAAYEGQLVGATVPTGVDGQMMDLVQELDKGGGEIVTGDSMLQAILDNFYGADGLVFKSKNVSSSSEPTVEAEQPEQGVTGTTPPPTDGETQARTETAANVPGAQHGEESQYTQFMLDELKQELSSRGLPFSSRATKAELVEALEQDDKTREGAGSDS